MLIYILLIILSTIIFISHIYVKAEFNLQMQQNSD